jgi:hypothetical protein
VKMHSLLGDADWLEWRDHRSYSATDAVVVAVASGYASNHRSVDDLNGWFCGVTDVFVVATLGTIQSPCCRTKRPSSLLLSWQFVS